MKKRGISGVVVAVLLILISVVAVGIIAGVIIPMTRERLEEATSCFDLLDYAKIIDLDYTCYTASNTTLTIQRGMENHSINGFAVSIVSHGSSKRFDLKDNMPITGVDMLLGGGIIKIPEPGGAETYVFNVGNGTVADLGIIIRGEKVCDAGSYDISQCI